MSRLATIKVVGFGCLQLPYDIDVPLKILVVKIEMSGIMICLQVSEIIK